MLSYYDLVDRIVVSYDAEHLGWTGVPIDVEQCLRRVRAVDRNGKCDYRPGHYARPAYFDQPMENDTHQRQVALDQASEAADWVLQLDTDEVIGDSGVFSRAIVAAANRGMCALNYPSLWLYSHAYRRWYLEKCRRGWRRAASYPGPLAVAAGTRVYSARRVSRTPEKYYHVDLSDRASSMAHPNHILVDQVVQWREAVFHFSWVRSADWLRNKFKSWSHANDQDWNPEVVDWLKAQHRPLLSTLLCHLNPNRQRRRLRLVRLPDNVEHLVAQSVESVRFHESPRTD